MAGCCFYCKKPPDYFLPSSFNKCNDKECPALPLDAVIRGMAQGTVLYKVKNPDRWFKRKYKVDVQNMRITHSPTGKHFWRDGPTIIDIYDVVEVRKGWNTDVFNLLEAKFHRHLKAAFHPHMKALLREENCFSIILSQSKKIVDLIAPNIHTRDAWVRGLNHLIATCKNSENKTEYDRWLKEQVRTADVNNNGSLNFNECLLLLNQLNISMERKEARVLFNSANFRKSQIDGEDALDAEEFVRFYHSLTHRPELEELMKRYSVSGASLISAEELQIFIQKEQKVSISLEECNHLIERYEPQNDKIHGFMTLKGFQQMLMSVEHDIFNKKHRFVYEDMTQPLNHYYIASSHNTYLLHGQLYGESSVEGYIYALMQGCRCLELDTWDGPDEEPVVFHGYTLTSRIFLRDILHAIRQYAFRVSQYPVILSIENHCTMPFQRKMAELFVTVLGDNLYKEPIGSSETQFPSPEVLARKILIKGKKLKDDDAENEDSQYRNNENTDTTSEKAVRVTTPTEALRITTRENSPEASPPMSPNLSAPVHHTVAKELSDLVNYCVPRSFSTFEECKECWCFYEMSSFQELTGLRLCMECGKEFVEFNKHHLSRVYPKGLRTDSSNYDPIPFWNVGCQMVALNYQTMDEWMYLNSRKFIDNGSCGYLLKPPFLRDNSIVHDPHKNPETSSMRHVLIKIISGQQIPKPNRANEGEVVDPYIVIKVSGHHLDAQKKRTSYIDNNGFNPVWNEMFLLTLHVPELAIISFVVKDMNKMGKNETLGQYALPYTCLTEGYRHIHLEDLQGQPIVQASLFVHITIGTYNTIDNTAMHKFQQHQEFK